MTQYIIDGPKIYPRQTVRRYCGMFAVQSIVERFGWSPKTVFDYASNIFTHWHGLTFPGGVQSVLRRYGFVSQSISYRSHQTFEKLSALKESLRRWYPIVALIWAGYKKVGEFSIWKAMIFQHYVTIWWYDDSKQVFYVYDSWKYLERHDNLPVWTVAMSYDDFLRYWNRWGVGFYKNLAIHVEPLD